MKTKNFQSSYEQMHIPHFLSCEIHTNVFEDPQNDKKKIKDFETSK
jgi:hypothetical protein